MANHPRKQQEPIKDHWDSATESESEEPPPEMTSSPETPTPASISSPFLRLPRELRLQIYLFAIYPLHTSHFNVPYSPWSPWGRNALTLVHTYPSCGALLATCRQIHWEILCLLDLKGIDLKAIRGRLKIIGDASCLDSEVLKGVLQCASQRRETCKGSRELIGSWSVKGKKNIQSHSSLHGILDASFPNDEAHDPRKTRTVELAIEDPPSGNWTGLEHDVPRFETWAATKSKKKDIKTRIHLLIRPSLLSERAATKWRAERPLDATKASSSKTTKGARLTRSEGAFIHLDEWERDWAAAQWRQTKHPVVLARSRRQQVSSRFDM
ncbi:hypothetical protein N0V90_001697 [Kalmusia sp. IMI 367209]|nr:hypothetical protein N0V90_001697 [Kalmusia sp. IMI 367209]